MEILYGGMQLKKLIIIIVILLVIFVGMVIRRNKLQSENNKQNATIEEIEQIEEYITKIYMWKEVTNEALPRFENINQASEQWLWQVVKKNLEEDVFSYEQIQLKAKELFGEGLSKQFPKDGVEGVIVVGENNMYNSSSIIIDEKQDKFLLNNIQKNTDGYVVEVVEYIENHKEAENVEDDTQEYNIILQNIQDEEIEKVSSTLSGIQIKEMVKNQINKYTKKKVILHKQENGKLVVIEVE